MTTYKTLYTASAALTFTLTSLATSATRVVGRESTAVDNRTNLFDDVLVSGRTKTGTTTANTSIDLWAYASYTDDLSTVAYPNPITGSDAAITFTTTTEMNSAMVLVQTIYVPDTTARTYHFVAFSIARLFGRVPTRWGLILAHNTGANLSSTAGDHVFHYQGIHGQGV